jgi:hypothetical protein
MECLSLYRGSIRATWNGAPLLGTPQISRKETALFWVRMSNNTEERSSQLLRGASLKSIM